MEIISVPSSNSSINIFEEGKEEEEIEDDESKRLYENAVDTFQKKQYKKAITYINTVESELDKNYFWKIIILKLNCYQEIIEKKILRDYNKTRLIKASKYFSLFNKGTNQFFNDLKINYNSNDYLNKCESIITLILRQCYNYSQFCIHQNLLYDTIAFLSLGERLIRNTSEFFISPDSDYYSTCILLFLSSLFIISDNYGNAKKYLIICLKLSYKELELRLDINNTLSLVNLDQYSEKDQEKINRIFFNISICFFHLGVCKENEYEFNEAYESYKQAKFFGNLIPNDDIIEYIVSLFNMEKRELLRLQLIEFFKKEEKNVKEVEVQNVTKNKIWYNHENIIKYQKLEEYIDKLNLREIDDEDPDLLNKIFGKGYSKKVGIPTKTVHVLNYLMDEKFKNVIDKMKKLDINFLSKKTKEIIHKQILKIKNEERAKIDHKGKEIEIEIENEKEKENENQKIKENQKENNDIQNFNNENEIKIEKEKEKEIKQILSENKKTLDENKIINHIKEKEKIKKNNINNIKIKNKTLYNSINNKSRHFKFSSKNNINSNLYINTGSSQVFSTSYESNNDLKPVSSLNKRITSRTTIHCSNRSQTYSKLDNLKTKTIEKIKYDYFTFNKNFKAKKKYLDDQFNRELKFQQRLLKCKSEENEFYKDENKYDERKIKSQCEDFFYKILSQEKKKFNDIKKKKDEQNNINKRVKRNYFKMSTKIVGRLLKKHKSIIKPDINNKKQIDKLTEEIDEIEHIKDCLISSYKRSINKKFESKFDY